MTAVFTISASEGHLDDSTLALLADVELDEMSIRALSEDLAADNDTHIEHEPAAMLEMASDESSSADGPAIIYPWTTSGLLEAAKHLRTCTQCAADRSAMLATFAAAWQEALVDPVPRAGQIDQTNQTLMNRHIATALGAFEETLPPSLSERAESEKQKESARYLGGFIGGAGKQKFGNRASDGHGWRASSFGRAIGIRRNQALIGFAAVAVAVPLLLQLRPAKQFGGVAMKSADTTVASSETAAVGDTTAEMAAETTAAAAVAQNDLSDHSSDAASPETAAELNQPFVPTSALPAGSLKGAGIIPAVSVNQSFDAVAETQAAAIDNPRADTPVVTTIPAPNTPPNTRPPAVQRVTTPPVTAAPVKTSGDTLAARLPSKDVAGGAVGGGASPEAPTIASASPVVKPAPKRSAKTKKTPTVVASNAAPKQVVAPASPASATSAASGQFTIPVVDRLVLNLGNVGSEADPTALLGRFRSAYDLIHPQPAAAATPKPAATGSITPSPAAAVAPAPAAAAPAAAVSADPVFAETGTPVTVAVQTVEQCVTGLFGTSKQRIVAAASGTLAGRTVWVIRVASSTGTVDLILDAVSCTELLRQPVS